MNKFITLVVAIASIGILQAEDIYIDAVKNCLGPNGGNYLHMKVKKNVPYKIKAISANAIFNKNDNAAFQGVGVMFVEPPRKMTMKSIAVGEMIVVRTEGNPYFFFVDDANLNKGGFKLSVEEGKE